MSDHMTIFEFTMGCLETWGGENTTERAFLGFAGEMGEVMEVRKKFLRGDYDEEEYLRRLESELCDAQYYLDMIFVESGICKTEGCRKLLDKLAGRKKNGTIQGDGSDRA